MSAVYYKVTINYQSEETTLGSDVIMVPCAFIAPSTPEFSYNLVQWKIVHTHFNPETGELSLKILRDLRFAHNTRVVFDTSYSTVKEDVPKGTKKVSVVNAEIISLERKRPVLVPKDTGVEKSVENPPGTTTVASTSSIKHPSNTSKITGDSRSSRSPAPSAMIGTEPTRITPTLPSRMALDTWWQKRSENNPSVELSSAPTLAPVAAPTIISPEYERILDPSGLGDQRKAMDRGLFRAPVRVAVAKIMGVRVGMGPSSLQDTAEEKKSTQQNEIDGSTLLADQKLSEKVAMAATKSSSLPPGESPEGHPSVSGDLSVSTGFLDAIILDEEISEESITRSQGKVLLCTQSGCTNSRPADHRFCGVHRKLQKGLPKCELLYCKRRVYSEDHRLCSGHYRMQTMPKCELPDCKRTVHSEDVRRCWTHRKITVEKYMRKRKLDTDPFLKDQERFSKRRRISDSDQADQANQAIVISKEVSFTEKLSMISGGKIDLMNWHSSEPEKGLSGNDGSTAPATTIGAFKAVDTSDLKVQSVDLSSCPSGPDSLKYFCTVLDDFDKEDHTWVHWRGLADLAADGELEINDKLLEKLRNPIELTLLIAALHHQGIKVTPEEIIGAK